MKEYIVQAIAQETIDSFDAHNAPELVRCKDCRYYTEPDSHGDRCDKIHWSRGDDWFCADGERRTDDA